MRAFLTLALVAAATTASAQDAKAPATKSAPATKQDTKAAATKAAATKAAGTKAGAPAGTKAPAQAGQGRSALTVAPEAAQRPRAPVIMREVFDYNAEGRRDPFVSLLATPELRPTVTDLRLMGILYDPSGRRSVVTLRDIQTNARYQVTTGTVLGRMKVVLIKPRVVIFSIEEFGLNRQDSLVLGDTSKARAR